MEYTRDQLEGILERLKEKMNLAVVYGGNKQEPGAVINVTQNTRPWKSYEIVANDIAHALRESGFKHVFAIPEGVRLVSDLRKSDIHMAWLNSAGVQGRNPMAHAPSVLEMAGIPYVGHSPLTATVLDNKHHFKSECQAYGIPTGRFLVWYSARGKLDPWRNSRFKTIFAGYYGPFVIKPVSGRASLGVSVVNLEELADAVEELYQQTHNAVLVEEYFGGEEYCVSVSGPIKYQNSTLVDLDSPFVFSELRRIFEKDEMIFTSMDIKPISKDRLRVLDASNASESDVVRRLRAIARTVYLDFDLSTLVRIDIRSDVYGNMFVLEANPKPDLKAFDSKSTSLVAVGLHMHGVSYEEYIYSLIADRVHRLFRNSSENIEHIVNLL